MGEKRKEKKPAGEKKGVQLALRILQHLMLAIVVASVYVVVNGSEVSIQGMKYSVNYNLHESDRNKAYEESELFNNIFGYSIADIIRFGVISSQLETEGKFDGTKEIDVTAYNYRTSRLPNQYVTAEYYLEDLLKWDSYGFERTVLETDPEAFLADCTRVTTLDTDSTYYNTSDVGYLKSDIGKYTFVSDVSANILSEDIYNTMDHDDNFGDTYRGVRDEDDSQLAEEAYVYDEEEWKYGQEILVNRYKTTEGKNLEEYVSDWELYYELLDNLVNAAESLAYNYEEYLTYKDYYSTKNSNVRYLITRQVGDENQYVTNLTQKKEVQRLLEMMEKEEVLEEESIPAGRYLYYSPADMVYQTNTQIQENLVQELLTEYDYAYPDKVKVWIGVDTSYPVEDAFTQGETGYQNFLPYFWQWLAAACVAALIYLMLLVYHTKETGKCRQEDNTVSIQLTELDRVPTEAALILGLLILGTACAEVIQLVSWYGWRGQSEWNLYGVNEISAFLAVAVFLLDVVSMFFFYSLVRRIKAGTLWSNSLLFRLYQKTRKWIWIIYDNGDIVVRTWVPYTIYLFFNVLMIFWALVACSAVIPILIAAVMDLLIGVLIYRDAKERQGIVEGIEKISSGELEYQIQTEGLHGDNLTLAESVNSIGKGIKDAVEISMKDERMKTDLITNVSHDIKTPLTSIINYVDLIKREEVEDEKIRGYIGVLDEKSQRLKQLTDDLVEASKISSGNIQLHIEKLNLTELMNQTIGEFSEKFEQKNLITVLNIDVENAVIEADSRRMWRVIENLFNNIYKYALEGTRVYVTLHPYETDREKIEISIKNISASPLNCRPEELTERFIRGDVSRTTEGSGLGLSIAKNLTEAQGGSFEIVLDGDLFKVVIIFPKAG